MGGGVDGAGGGGAALPANTVISAIVNSRASPVCLSVTYRFSIAPGRIVAPWHHEV